MHTVATNALDTLAGLIHDASVNTVKVTVQCFATIYPLLFRKMYATRQDPEYISRFAYMRGTSVQVHSAEHATAMGPAGTDESEDTRPCVVATRARWRQDLCSQVHAASDPCPDQGPKRSQSELALTLPWRVTKLVSCLLQLQKKDDMNISMLPADHPFMSAAALEAEGAKLLEGIITILYTSS